MYEPSSKPSARVAPSSVAVSLLRGALIAAGVFLAVAPVWAADSQPQALAQAQGYLADAFNRAGNILIADQFNNRVIEVDQRGNIVWSFGIGPTDFSAASVIGVNDAERIGTLTLMTGTGTPPNTVPTCTDPNGCPDNRVLLVDQAGRIVFQYGQFGITGSDFNQLNTPVQATYLPSGNLLITDQGNQRVIEVNRSKSIVWQYGVTGETGDGSNHLSDPNSAELLDNGNVLIADEGNNRAIEVTRAGRVVASFTAGGTVSGAAFASRLVNGDTLITDAGNSRVVEVDPRDRVVWQFFTNTQSDSAASPAPTRAIRLSDGNTMISDQFNQRVIVVSPLGTIVATFGRINARGFGDQTTGQGLFAPYDAKVIDDFNGITPPQAFDFDRDHDIRPAALRPTLLGQ